MNMTKPELLAPAGSFEKLKMALAYGADAVYFGGKAFGLRAFSDNFSDDQLAEALGYVHSRGKKAYVTVNIFPHNDDLTELPDYLRFLAAAQADAVILSDLGVYRMVREVAPGLPIHVSTQANNTNWSSVKMWQELGVSRVVLARELSLTEIKDIRSKVTVELETSSRCPRSVLERPVAHGDPLEFPAAGGLRRFRHGFPELSPWL